MTHVGRQCFNGQTRMLTRARPDFLQNDRCPILLMCSQLTVRHPGQIRRLHEQPSDGQCCAGDRSISSETRAHSRPYSMQKQLITSPAKCAIEQGSMVHMRNEPSAQIHSLAHGLKLACRSFSDLCKCDHSMLGSGPIVALQVTKPHSIRYTRACTCHPLRPRSVSHPVMTI